MTELLVAYPLFKAGTGFSNGPEIILVGQHARMQRPLPAPPGTALVDCAADQLVVKNTMAFPGLHLHHRTGDAPVSLLGFLRSQSQGFNHPVLIPLVKGHGGFPVTAEAATGACEDVGNVAGRRVFIGHDKKKRRISEESTL